MVVKVHGVSADGAAREVACDGPAPQSILSADTVTIDLLKLVGADGDRGVCVCGNGGFAAGVVVMVWVVFIVVTLRCRDA